MAFSNCKVISEIARGYDRKIITSCSLLQKTPRIDIRENYLDVGDDSKPWKPTKKGLNFSVEETEAVIEGLLAAVADVKERLGYSNQAEDLPPGVPDKRGKCDGGYSCEGEGESAGAKRRNRAKQGRG